MKTKLLTISILFLFLFQSICAVSISCNDCDVKNCKCNTECSSGFMIVYLEKCLGSPKYEVPIVAGLVNWQPPMKGTYYSKLLCDDGEKSNCEQIVVPTKIIEQVPSGNYFPYLIILAFVLVLVFLAYSYSGRK